MDRDPPYLTPSRQCVCVCLGDKSVQLSCGLMLTATVCATRTEEEEEEENRRKMAIVSSSFSSSSFPHRRRR